MKFLDRLSKCIADGLLPERIGKILEKFYLSYVEAITENGHAIEEYLPTLQQFLDLIIKEIKEPFTFEPYHRAITEPIDYYHFGQEIIRPLVIFEASRVVYPERIADMEKQLANGHNVILLANHQTEPDPQAISLLLENDHHRLAQEMIFIAGHRVISDPMAVPFSMGRNLLCIYSKKHVENPPEQKTEKLQHNQRTMKLLSQLLAEGGKCIYVAPSGGRDRPDADGQVDVAPFDPQSIEMLWLMAQQAGTPTHFYPMALYTYPLLPPPNSVEVELGERRQAHCTPIHLAFAEEVDMENFPGAAGLPKKEKRQVRANYIWKQVQREYQRLIQD